MIQAVLVFNNYGKVRLMKFYSSISETKQHQIISEMFKLVSQKPSGSCNFIEKSDVFGGDCKIMYKHFTTLYFVFCCDASESELAILDLIQVFVEALDKSFKNVCELDLIFHVDRAHHILDEIVMGGVVLDTNIAAVLFRYEEQKELEQREMRATHMIPNISANLADRLPSRLLDIKLQDVFNVK